MFLTDRVCRACAALEDIAKIKTMSKNHLGWNSLHASILIFVLALNVAAKAETIEFPEEELSQETVLPRFDRPDSVRRRNVTTANKFELGGYYGWNITEPIYEQSKFGFNAGYHWSEESAFMVNYAQWNSGLNKTYTDSIESTSTPPLDFTRIPKIKYSLYGHYEWNIYYGKISLTKQGVVNLSTYPIFGGGITAYEHKTYPGVDFGIGQKFYFTKSIALRADLKLQYSQKPSPFLEGALREDQPVPTPGQFKEKWDLGTILDFGLSILL